MKPGFYILKDAKENFNAYLEARENDSIRREILNFDYIKEKIFLISTFGFGESHYILRSIDKEDIGSVFQSFRLLQTQTSKKLLERFQFIMDLPSEDKEIEFFDSENNHVHKILCFNPERLEFRFVEKSNSSLSNTTLEDAKSLLEKIINKKYTLKNTDSNKEQILKTQGLFLLFKKDSYISKMTGGCTVVRTDGVSYADSKIVFTYPKFSKDGNNSVLKQIRIPYSQGKDLDFEKIDISCIPDFVFYKKHKFQGNCEVVVKNNSYVQLQKENKKLLQIETLEFLNNYFPKLIPIDRKTLRISDFKGVWNVDGMGRKIMFGELYHPDREILIPSTSSQPDDTIMALSYSMGFYKPEISQDFELFESTLSLDELFTEEKKPITTNGHISGKKIKTKDKKEKFENNCIVFNKSIYCNELYIDKIDSQNIVGICNLENKNTTIASNKV